MLARPGDDRLARSRLPDYAPMLAAYHRAFSPELRAMIGGLPLRAGDRVLEIACGDGAYGPWLAERAGPSGQVVAVDRSHEFLAIASQARSGADGAAPLRFAAADLARLPFEDDAFDLVWCAQSLYSLPEPVESLRRMRRVVRPGGVVAVLENDSLHQVLLPWPVPVELAVRCAEWRGFVEESDDPRKFYIARDLVRVFHDAGLVPCRERTWASNRQAPLEPTERAFLALYLADLRERASHHLDRETRDLFEPLADPSHDHYLLDRPDFSFTCIDHVVWGIKSEAGDRLVDGAGTRAVYRRKAPR